MKAIHGTAFAASAGLLAGRLIEQLPREERTVWLRAALGVLALAALVSLLLSGCSIEAEGHKVAFVPMPGWSWSYHSTSTNAETVLK